VVGVWCVAHTHCWGKRGMDVCGAVDGSGRMVVKVGVSVWYCITKLIHVHMCVGNALAWWQHALLSPTATVDARVEALSNLDSDSRWRHAVLRHDTRLWQFFPDECASFQSSISNRGDDAGGTGCDNTPGASWCGAKAAIVCVDVHVDGWVCTSMTCGASCVCS